MIKHRIFSIATFICSLMCASMAMAQEVYVDVRAKQNPLPAQAALYVENPGRFFSVSLTNISEEAVPVRLEVRLEGPIESQMDIWPDGGDYLAIVANRPIEYYQYLNTGQARTMTDSELNLMFNQYTNNERYAGGRISEIFNDVTGGHVGLLPEGHYGLKVIVKTNYIDQGDQGRVIGEGECYFDISYKASAPSFIEPNGTRGDGYILADFPYQTGRFAWTPPAFSNNRMDGNRNIIYDFRIMRVTEGMTPFDAATSGAVAFEQKGLMTTFCNVPYPVITTLRRSGNTRYVAQVTARSMVSDASSNQFVMIDNEGKSEIMELYLPPFNIAGTDNDITIPGDGTYPIIATIKPKAQVLNSNMEPYFKTPSQLFTITVKNTASQEYEVSMLLQFHKGNWGVCPTPALQHSNQSMTIPGGAEITLDDETVDRLIGNYPMESIIAFKAESGFIIGPPTQNYFTDVNNFATLRVCEYTGQPVLREKIIGKARCEYTVDDNVTLGGDFKIEITPKVSIMPSDSTLFTNPSKYFSLKITNIGLTKKKITGRLQYIIEDKRIYSGYDKDNKRLEQFLELNPGQPHTISDADFERLFGGFKSISIFEKTSDLMVDNNTEKTDDQPFSKCEFSYEDGNTNIARFSLIDYEKFLKNKEKPSEAFLLYEDCAFEVSDYIKTGRVKITFEKALAEMPTDGTAYIAEPGKMFKITLENTSDGTLLLMPQLIYSPTFFDEVAHIECAPLQSYGENIGTITLLPGVPKTFTVDEINKLLGGAQKDIDDDGEKDVVAVAYNDDTNEIKQYTEFESMFIERANYAKLVLYNALLYEQMSKDLEQKGIALPEKLVESSAVCLFNSVEDATLNEIDIEIKQKSTTMPQNPDAYFDKPEQLWDITLRNTTDKSKSFVLYPRYNFNGEDGVYYTTHKLKDLQVITLASGKSITLSESEIHKYFSSRNVTRVTEDGDGHTSNEELYYYDLGDEIKVSTELDNTLEIFVFSPEITSDEIKGVGKTIGDFQLGTTNSYWIASDGYNLNDFTITITPKEEYLNADSKSYFESPGALFDVEIKNNTNKDQKALLSMTYQFDENGPFYVGHDDARYDKAVTITKYGTKKLSSEEVNNMCGRFEQADEVIKLPDREEQRKTVIFKNVKVNLTSYNQVGVTAYNVDSLKNIQKADVYRKTKSFLGFDKCDFNAREGINDVGLKVKITPKSGVVYKSDSKPYYEKPGDLFDVTLINENAVDANVKLRITYNKRFYGYDRDSVITIKKNTTLKLNADRFNKLNGEYNLYADPIFELDEKGELIGTKEGKEVVMKEGVNIVSALMWREKKVDDESKFDKKTFNKDYNKLKVDTICVHDTIFVSAFSKIKIGEYELTLTETEKTTGGDKEQEKLKNECYKGKGFVTVPMLGKKVNLNVTYDSIYINWVDKKVVKGNVITSKPETQFFPAELFSDDIKNKMREADSTAYDTKVKHVLDSCNITEYYRWVQKDMQYFANFVSGENVTLPIGLAFPMSGDGGCPADIQLARMEFTPDSATMDLIGEFVLPETDYLGNVTYDNGVTKYNGDILVFAAQDLTTSPSKFLPQSGSIGLLTDVTVHDPNTGFDFTFVAPKARFNQATSGCFITWKNGNFDALSASIKVNLPGGEVVKVGADGVVDSLGTAPSVQLDALIHDGSDWFANVSMDNFEIADLPGYTFIVGGGHGAGDTGIYYDHSRRTTRGGEVKSGEMGRVEFHPDYYDKNLGGSGKPASDQMAYNAWQGFYFKQVGVELPKYDMLNNASDARPKITLNNLLYDDTGFSISATAKNVIDYKTERAGGWRFSIDSIAVSILQSNFMDTGFKGKIGVPLLKDKKLNKDSIHEPAFITYKAKIISIDKSENNKAGTSTTFELDQEVDSMAIDCFLADVYLDNSKTWLWLNHNTTRPEGKQTYFDLKLGGSIKVTCVDFNLPEIPFSGLGYANCTEAEKKEAEKPHSTKTQSKTQQQTQPSDLQVSNGEKILSIGDWDFNSNDAKKEETYFHGLPVYVKDFGLDVIGIDTVGIKFECGISILGSEKAGVSAGVGLGIYTKVDWENFDLKYDKTKVSSVTLDGSFGGVVKVGGSLEISQTDEKKGFATKSGAPLSLSIKGLFDLKVAGGYYKVKKTEADLALDNEEEQKKEYFHAGYFLGQAANLKVPIGPVQITKVMGGLFLNYGTTAGGVSGMDKSFYSAIQENAKIKYKTYGGAFGLGLSSTGTDALMKGDLNFMLLMDLSGDEVKVPEFHMQGNIHALCASADAENGLINARVDMLFQDNTDPARDHNKDQTQQCKRFVLNMTVEADGTIDKLYEQFTGEKLEVPKCIGEYLDEFDQKKADDDNKGEGTDNSNKSTEAESKGFLKGGCSASVKMELEVRTYPYAVGGSDTKWHLYIGKPSPETERCRITFIDFEIGKDKPVGLWAKIYANAYLCMGNELPDNGALPPVPDKVLEALGMKGADGKSHPENMAKLEAARAEQMSGFKDKGINGGIMLGAALGAEIGCNAVFCYASVEGMLGFDMVLKKFKAGSRCGDGSLMGGKNGFYATGQLYAMLKGELGLMLDLWIYKGKVPLVDMTLGALLQGGFPNPSWVYGRMRASGSVLGGLIKFNSTIEMKAGRVCVPAFGNPLDDVKIFGDFNPGDEELESGWAEDKAVSPYGTVNFTTNMKMGKYLPLVDQTRTANNIGMDIPEEGEDVEDKTVLRTYVFYLGRVDSVGNPISSVPTFEFTQYSNGNSDNRPEKPARYIECKNPSFDQENFTLVTGSLEANKFYRVNLSGYCKEIINGKPVNPIFNDSTTNYQDSAMVWDQIQPVYFRTGEFSKNIVDDVVGYTPMAVDDKANYYTCSLDDACNPTLMMGNDREDYWNNPDYEFSASVMEYAQRTDDNGNVTYDWVLPDAKDGLYRGEKSVFQNLDIMLYTETGVDQYGDEYKYQTVKLAKPLPSKYFTKGSRYKLEITRFNRKMMTDQLNILEEKYEDMMKIVAADKATFEAELEKMNDDEAAVAKQMYDYYQAMEEEYGENTAEQRKTEYIEQAKQNKDMFVEIVWSHEYTYNGFATFQDYVKKYYSTAGNYFRSSSVTLSNNKTLNPTIQWSYVDRVLGTYALTRDNNPYYAMNFWHSKAFVWYGGDSGDKDGKLDKFKYCDSNILANEGIEFGTYEEKYAGSARTKLTSLPPYAEIRPISLNILNCDWGARREDYQVEYMLDPLAGQFNRQTRWHDLRSNAASLFEGTANVIRTIYMGDSEAVDLFEGKLGVNWLTYTYHSTYPNLSSKAVSKFKERNTWAYDHKLSIEPKLSRSGGVITAPFWQLGLMLAADQGGIIKEKIDRPTTVQAYRYYTNLVAYDYDPNKFLANIKQLSFSVRYVDGYNLSNSTFGVRPETEPRRSVKVDYKYDNGINGSLTQSTFTTKTGIHVGDPEMHRYLMNKLNKSNGSEFTAAELASITSLDIDYSKYQVKTICGLEHMPNVTTITIQNFDNYYNSGKIKPFAVYGDLTLLPKLASIFIKETDCKNLTFDTGKLTKLTTLSFYECENLYSIKFRHCPSLTIFKIENTSNSFANFDPENLSKFPNITSLDLIMTQNDTISIVGFTKLRPYNVCVKDYKGSSKRVKLVADRTTDNQNYFATDSWKAKNSFTGKAADCKVDVVWNRINVSQLDPNLRAALEEKFGKDVSLNSNTKLHDAKSLDVSGRKIKSLKYLDYFCPLLESLNVENNRLDELDLGGFANLDRVYAANNYISYLNVRDDNKIAKLDVTNNQLPSLPTTKLGSLSYLYCSGNILEELYLNDLKKLVEIDCSNNVLSELVMDQLTNLTEINCSNNTLTVFNLPTSFKTTTSILRGISNTRFESLKAINCFGSDVQMKLDLSGCSGLKDVYVSDNPGLVMLALPRNNVEIVEAKNCALNGTFTFEPSMTTNEWTKLIRLDLSNNPNLNVAFNAKKMHSTIGYVNFTGCELNNVVISGNVLNSALQVRVGVPQRINGNKVKVVFNKADWSERWEEWFKYPENRHTVVAYFNTGRTIIPYDKNLSATLETITEEDQLMRKDFGEKLYASLLKEKNSKLNPMKQTRAFHVADAKALTTLNAGFTGITDARRVLRWMPNLTDIDLSGNKLELTNLNVGYVDGKPYVFIHKTNNLNLANNPQLGHVTIPSSSSQYITNLDLTNSNLTNVTFVQSTKYVKNKLIIDNPSGSINQYTLNGTDNLKVLYFGNTSKTMKIQKCSLDSLVLTGTTVIFPTASFSDISIDNIIARNGAVPKFSHVVTGKPATIAKNVEIEGITLVPPIVQGWMMVTSDKLTLNNCDMKTTVINKIDTKVNELVISNNSNININQCNISKVVVNDSKLLFKGNNTIGINIGQLIVNGNSTLYFESADMMLMWLYGWSTQNEGSNVKLRVATSDSSKQPLADMANAFIASGQLDLTQYSTEQVVQALETLIEKGFLPRGVRYYDTLKKITTGEPLVTK